MKEGHGMREPKPLINLYVLEAGDDERGAPFVRFSMGPDDPGFRVPCSREQAVWASRHLYKFVPFVAEQAERPAPPPPTTVPSAGVPRQDDGR